MIYFPFESLHLLLAQVHVEQYIYIYIFFKIIIIFRYTNEDVLYSTQMDRFKKSLHNGILKIYIVGCLI